VDTTLGILIVISGAQRVEQSSDDDWMLNQRKCI
jgi:hypothetical protein